MRKQLMDGLRKAGTAFRNFDDSYGEKVASFIAGDRINAVTGPLAVLAGAPVTRRATDLIEYTATDPKWLTAFGKAAEYGIPAAASGIRYGLPIYGVTQAGRALIDLTAQFGGPADQQQSSQLPL